MFSVPLICPSSGVATVSAMTLGLAPGNCAFTTTVGGTTSGYSEIGSWKTETAPARKMTTEMTPAKIGRSMKNRERFMAAPYGVLSTEIPSPPFRGEREGPIAAQWEGEVGLAACTEH